MTQQHSSIFGSDTQSKALYKVAGAAVVLIVTAGIVDVITSNMGVGARDNSSIQMIEWFMLFHTNPFAAFSGLGLINLITLTLSIPVYLAFNQAYRHDHPVLAAFASILFFMGTVVYMSSNTVFALFAISQQYASALTAQKPVLEAAGRALLAQGADLTPGTFVGLFFTQIAGLLIASGMLKGGLFGRWTGRAGLAGFSLTSIFFILAAFLPEHYDTAILFAMPGGLILMAYQIMLARRFFQLGR